MDALLFPLIFWFTKSLQLSKPHFLQLRYLIIPKLLSDIKSTNDFNSFDSISKTFTFAIVNSSLKSDVDILAYLEVLNPSKTTKSRFLINSIMLKTFSNSLPPFMVKNVSLPVPATMVAPAFLCFPVSLSDMSKLW